MKLQVIYKSEHMYLVCKSDRNDNLVLDVMVGGIGMWSERIELLPEETIRFQTVGHLDELAGQVARQDPRIEGRRIKRVGDETIEYVESI